MPRGAPSGNGVQQPALRAAADAEAVGSLPVSTTVRVMEAKRRDMVGPLCFHTAIVLTLWALLVNNISLASSAYTSVVVQAIVCSVAALVLIAIGWNRLPSFARAMAAVIILANAWTLLDAGGRRLPAILGW